MIVKGTAVASFAHAPALVLSSLDLGALSRSVLTVRRSLYWVPVGGPVLRSEGARLYGSTHVAEKARCRGPEEACRTDPADKGTKRTCRNRAHGRRYKSALILSDVPVAYHGIMQSDKEKGLTAGSSDR